MTKTFLTSSKCALCYITLPPRPVDLCDEQPQRMSPTADTDTLESCKDDSLYIPQHSEQPSVPVKGWHLHVKINTFSPGPIGSLPSSPKWRCCLFPFAF